MAEGAAAAAGAAMPEAWVPIFEAVGLGKVEEDMWYPWRCHLCLSGSYRGSDD